MSNYCIVRSFKEYGQKEKIVRSNCVVLVLFLLAECKTNQHSTAMVKTDLDGYEYIELTVKQIGQLQSA